MKAHIIENNKVVNTIEVESLDFLPNLIDGSIGGIGWDYIDGELAEPYVAPLAMTIEQAIAHFEKLTTSYIQNKVDEYNKTNGLAFKDIDSFTKYALIPTSEHNAIALQFITYADSIWKALRAYQATLTAIPADVEVLAILDGVVF